MNSQLITFTILNERTRNTFTFLLIKLVKETLISVDVKW